MNYKDLLAITTADEDNFTFPSFDRDNVLDLAMEMIGAISQFEGPLALEIHLNGLMVFRYYPKGTNANNELWLRRKRNTVYVTEKSTLRVFAELKCSGESLEKDMLLDPMEYVACGGGFPIRLKGGCVIGFIGVSGLPHLRDHDALVAGLSRYFSKHINPTA